MNCQNLYLHNCNNLKNGVSGIMRVKNDGMFISKCVESCISALDELIIVWNECSDNSAEEIEKVKSKYPNKIKTYEYKHKVYSINLSKKEYEYVKSLSNDSPHLLCNYYNFALSKVTYRYALKIDADQLYYTEKLERICNIVKHPLSRLSYSVIIGFLLFFIFRINRKFSHLTKLYKIYYPNISDPKFWHHYEDYVSYRLSKRFSPISLSGVNVFIDGGNAYVTIGNRNNNINILPPYNGIGDHLLFEVKSDTYYVPQDSPYYRILRTENYSYIENFVHNQGKALPIGLCWYHLNSLREPIRTKVKEVKKRNPSLFIPIKDFAKLTWNTISLKVDYQMAPKEQLASFAFIHQFDNNELIVNIKLLASFMRN